jgi:hypothetical protein
MLSKRSVRAVLRYTAEQGLNNDRCADYSVFFIFSLFDWNGRPKISVYFFGLVSLFIFSQIKILTEKTFNSFSDISVYIQSK